MLCKYCSAVSVQLIIGSDPEKTLCFYDRMAIMYRVAEKSYL